MADNSGAIDNGANTDYNVATDKVTHSGDADVDVQLIRPIHVTGSEGSKTVVAITDADGQFAQGSIAHDGVDSGKPVKIGGKVLADHDAVPADVAVSDRVDAWFERSGALVISNAESQRSAATAVWQVASTQTPVDSTVEIDCSRMGNAMIWWLPITGTISGGAFRFECSPDGGTTWAQLSGQCFDFTMASYDFAGETATQIGGGTVPNGWRFPTQGMDKIRIKLTTVLSGTASSWSNEFGASSAGGAETASIRIYLRSTAVSGQAHSVVRQGDGDRLRIGSNTRRLTDTVANAVSTTDSCVIDCEGFTSAPALGIGGTWGGTLVIEQSADGSSYTTATGFEISGFAIGNTGLGTITANGLWMLTSFAGQRYIKVRGATISSGTANVAATSNGLAGNLWTLSGGDKSHDAPDAISMPVKVGMKAIAHGANPTAVAADDRTNWYANRHGIPWVIGGHPNTLTLEYRATSAQTNDDILGAISAGTKVVVTAIHVMADNANTVDVGVRIGFGAASVPTEPTDGNNVLGVVFSHPGIAPGSGAGRGDGSGIIGCGADGEELRLTCEVPTGGSIKVVFTCYAIES